MKNEKLFKYILDIFEVDYHKDYEKCLSIISNLKDKTEKNVYAEIIKEGFVLIK